MKYCIFCAWPMQDDETKCSRCEKEQGSTAENAKSCFGCGKMIQANAKFCPFCKEENIETENNDNHDAKIEEIIINAFRPYGYSESGINSKSVFVKGRYEKVPREKFLAGISSYARDITIDDIIVYVDSTLGGSGTDGMIITKDRVYYRSNDPKETGSIDILSMRDINCVRKFWGNKVDITDADGDVYHLGQVAALKEQLDALNDSFEQLIEDLKPYRD